MANAAKQVGPRKLNAPGWSGQPIPGGFSNGGGHRSRSSKGLPPPIELAGRIEEARTSAKLLLQLVQSTPANELIGNELVKEFAERCTAAQRSVQGYIASDNPAPDDDTMLTLIETNEQLSLAASKHQRAILQARRLHGPSPSPPISQTNSHAYPPPAGVPQQVYSPPSLPPRHDAPGVSPLNAPPTESSYVPPSNSSYASPPESTYSPPSVQTFAPPANQVGYKNDELPLPPALQAGGNRSRPISGANEDNPFADHHTSTYTPHAVTSNTPSSNGYSGAPEPYHPGVQSTPSYLGRQESSANNLTMRGAQPQISEEEEYARDYPAAQRPRTPEHSAPRQQSQNDVSPVAERKEVTYRY